MRNANVPRIADNSPVRYTHLRLRACPKCTGALRLATDRTEVSCLNCGYAGPTATGVDGRAPQDPRMRGQPPRTATQRREAHNRRLRAIRAQRHPAT